MQAVNRRNFLKLCAASLAFSAAPRMAGAARNRPLNVLFLFTDDQAYDTIHALGNAQIKTPNMDRLVREGVSFTNAYIMGGSSPAVCCPSRACLMSGQTLWNVESQDIWSFDVSDKYTSLPEAFRKNGYVTFGTGKQHNGTGSFLRSFSQGSRILFHGMSDQYVLPLREVLPDGTLSEETVHRGKQSAEVYADATIEFLKQAARSDQPFFAYVAFQTPHDPREMPKEYRDQYDAKKIELPASYMPRHPFDNGMLDIRDEKLAGFPRKPDEIQGHIAAYYAMITHTDAQIGRILDTLTETGKADSTLIVFSSDNGLAVGRHGLMGKQNVYEHSVRVPLVLSGPGIPRGERRAQLCYIYDLYPTLCERLGIETPANVQFRSFSKAIDDADAAHRSHVYCAFMSWQRSLRDERYKLIEYCVDGNRHTQLFDLAKDPMEISNLAGKADYDDTLDGLRTVLKEERVRLNDGNAPYAFTDKQGKDFWNAYDAEMGK